VTTFREFATKAVEEGIADLTSRGEICDGHGVLAGAMVDAATIAVQEWLRVGVDSEGEGLSYDAVGLIREAGRVTP
jgi:hypothetical protein